MLVRAIFLIPHLPSDVLSTLTTSVWVCLVSRADDLFLAANITAEDVVLVTATVQAASSVVTLQGASGSESSNASMEGSDWSLDSDRHKKVERASAALVQVIPLTVDVDN